VIAQYSVQSLSSRWDNKIMNKWYTNNVVYLAVAAGDDVSMINLLIDHGASLSCDGRTAVRTAIICRRYNVLEMLLTGGADKTDVTQTDINFACVRGFNEIAKLLVEYTSFVMPTI
jgi:ankyrin repeat protein